MAVNKVIVGGEVKIDLTADTVSENNLLEGATAHNAAGNQIKGVVVAVPVDEILNEASHNAIENMAVAKAVKGGEDRFGSTRYTLNDSVEYPLIGLKLFGKSIQNGTPTPENPAPIVSIENPTITISNGTDRIFLAIADTLNGIPVSSGGNVLIDGREYIADYLDFDKGVKVQRVEAIKLSANNFLQFDINRKRVAHRINQHIVEGNSVNYTMCNCLIPSYAAWSYESGSKYFIFNQMLYMWTQNFGIETKEDWETFIANNDVIVYHVLATPIESPISKVEIQDYRQLHTYNGVTNISNDKGAGLEVSYCTNKAFSTCVAPITSGLQKQIDDLKATVLGLSGNA